MSDLRRGQCIHLRVLFSVTYSGSGAERKGTVIRWSNLGRFSFPSIRTLVYLVSTKRAWRLDVLGPESPSHYAHGC